MKKSTMSQIAYSLFLMGSVIYLALLSDGNAFNTALPVVLMIVCQMFYTAWLFNIRDEKKVAL